MLPIMSHPLLDTLMLKIRTMLTEQATLQVEISQLTSEIKRLEEQQLILAVTTRYKA